MLTEKIKSAINEQINAELWSAYLYLSMSLDAQSKALRGAVNWFFVQWLEEQDTARTMLELSAKSDKDAVLLPQLDNELMERKYIRCPALGARLE